MTTQAHTACLLLGSNIQPEKNLALGVALLRQKFSLIRLSSVWETCPVGSDGPDFLNLAVLISTPLEAGELKEKLLRSLEAQLGRVRRVDKNAPRPIDIDIVIFDGMLFDSSLWRYVHRAVPVAEILPDYLSSQGDCLKVVASRLAKMTPIRLRSDVQIDGKLNAS